MNVAKIGARSVRPNRIIATTIQTKTDVQFKMAVMSLTTPRAKRPRAMRKPASRDTRQAPANPSPIR